MAYEPTYTLEETEQLRSAYQTEKDIHILASKFGKTPRSIVSKLVHLDIYEKPTPKQTLRKNTKQAKQCRIELEQLLDITLSYQNNSHFLSKEDYNNILSAIHRIIGP